MRMIGQYAWKKRENRKGTEGGGRREDTGEDGGGEDVVSSLMRILRSAFVKMTRMITETMLSAMLQPIISGMECLFSGKMRGKRRYPGSTQTKGMARHACNAWRKGMPKKESITLTSRENNA